MTFQIVLVHPLIPQNTGNLARLTAATNSTLHLIEPLGFSLEDRYVKRAGLDYWSEVSLICHPSWGEFLRRQEPTWECLWLFSSKASVPYHTVSFKPGDYLVFGNEGEGLPEKLHREYNSRRLCIPMDNTNIRSLNLANAAAICLYEARRQCGLLDRR